MSAFRSRRDVPSSERHNPEHRPSAARRGCDRHQVEEFSSMNERTRGDLPLRLLALFSIVALVAACSSSGGAATASSAASSSGPGAAASSGSGKPLIYAIYKLGTQQYFIDQAAGATE